MIDKNTKLVKEQLKNVDRIFSGGSLSLQPTAPDGSTRQFFRIFEDGEIRCMAVLPPSGDSKAIQEAESTALIGRHLLACGVRVPEVYWHDQKTGLILFEDLGDMRLYEQIKAAGASEIIESYQAVIDSLLQMQFSGLANFDPSWCYDTAEYDAGVMINQESEYFERAFLHDLAKISSPDGLAAEFAEIAECAGSGTACFLHRDFQSRNIMVKNGTYYIIDFQGGRVGPPGYDLASLLNDPYVALKNEVKKHLHQYYLEKFTGLYRADGGDFKQSYPYLALQRNMQIIGAFAFLYSVRKKEFFRPFILPSLMQLKERLEQKCFARFTALKKAAGQAAEKILQSGIYE
ncbi:MAG: aminoglycoside phosphotransferase [Deltaproteobacteria bacterium]|nr:MAG: aminoglycoside phosphotransferase [Deltaproteobacteria bacterium]